MLGPYKAINSKKQIISYKGNKLFKPIKDVNKRNLREIVKQRFKNISTPNAYWSAITKINNNIFYTTVRYFERIGAKFALLPLTSRMISSPGALYGKGKLDYTQDTVPVKLTWFKSGQTYLTESSQLYLELYLLQNGIDQVFSIYNSFRKEEANFCHVPEFHHIEYEGHVTQKENKKIIINLIKSVIRSLLNENEKDLKFFIDKDDLNEIETLTKRAGYKEITLKKALEILYTETGLKKYQNFSSKWWGSWEEAFVSSYFNKIILVKDFPLLEVAFYYHQRGECCDKPIADNDDFIFPGYKEIAGSGRRVENLEKLEKKAKIFNLPKKDYTPYLYSRRRKDYKASSGFGLGWERFLHGLLKMPTIIDVQFIPRVGFSLYP